MNITYINKPLQEDEYNPDFWNSQDANEIKTVVNANNTELQLKANITDLTSKADKVNGLVPLAQLPTVTFSSTQFNVSTSGSAQEISIKTDVLGGEINSQLKSISGYNASEQQIPYNNNGTLMWGVVPTGGGTQEELSPTVLYKGTATSDSCPFTWDGITDATSYTLQISTSSLFNPTVVGYSGNALSATVLNLTYSTTYYARVRGSAVGFTSSQWSSTVSFTTDVQGNFTPIVPTITANDSANTLTSAHALGASEIVMSVNNLGYVAYAGQINVGNIVRDAGYWKFKIKSTTGRNESAVVNSPAFTEASLPVPNAPTNGVVDDVSNTFNWDNVTGNNVVTDYQKTDDGGITASIATTKPIVIGDVARSAGQVGIRLKAVAGVRQASPWLFNTSAFTETEPDTSVAVTSITGDNVEYVPSYTNWYQNKTGQYGFGATTQKILLGESSFIQMDVSLNAPSGILVVSPNTNGEGLQPNAGTSILLQVNGSDNKIQVGGTVNSSASFVFSPTLSVISKVRIRTDGSNMMAEYFTTSWQLLSTRPQVSDLYIKLFFEDFSAPNQRYIKNLKGLNLA